RKGVALATTPVIIASERGEVGLVAAMELLRSGASAMDAVEVAVRAVEANESDHYVGVGGLPNLLGEVELDASIMDGATRRAGAVAAVTGFPHPISIARAVCDRLPQHLLLVGTGAERFADEVGIERGPTLTDEASKKWREGLEPDALEVVAESQGDGELAYRRQVIERLAAMSPPDGPWGTVNVIALDAEGNLAVGVSTSGYPWKYPGRVGDSALIGAGNYCDNRVGGAACTGRGELAIRANTAREILLELRAGRGPAEACAAALAETLELPDDYRSPLQALCLTPDGSHGGASTKPGSTYSVMTAADETYRIEERAQL
ncbi:MAG: isoaspartyl peptidase/L-asparaginase, partial [Nocardiopsaceae bacterium]|nr:isoaspartyl peptidase/L-asparaginase [Nocardiopsaceae bacterium]